MTQDNESGKLVFRWHFLVIYLLIAAVISYQLVDYKLDRDAPSTTTPKTTHEPVKVTQSDDSDFDVDDGGAVDVFEPGTIGEQVTKEESTTEEGNTSKTTDEESTKKKPNTTKKDSSKTTTEKSSTTEKDTTKTTETTEKTTKPTTETTTTTTTEPTTTEPATTDVVEMSTGGI